MMRTFKSHQHHSIIPPTPTKHRENLWQIQAQFLVALQNVDLETCYSLIRAGADCDQLFKVNSQEQPAISIAARRNEYELVELLINHGCSINLRDSNGCSTLHIAVQNGSDKICQLLIRNRADVNAVNDTGLSPLHMAIQRKSLLLTELLILHGSEINRKDHSGKTGLHHACYSPMVNHDIIKLLIKHGGLLNELDDYGWTPLLYLLHSSRYTFETVQLFIARGARLDICTPKGRTPVHQIVLSYAQDKYDCLDLVLKNGCDVNAQTYEKQTALHMSILMNNVALVKMLLLANASYDSVDILGITPFSLALALGRYELVNLLIAVGLRLTPEQITRCDFKYFSQSCREKLAQKLQNPMTLGEIGRKNVYKLYGPFSYDKINELNGKEFPTTLRSFLLLDEE